MFELDVKIVISDEAMDLYSLSNLLIDINHAFVFSDLIAQGKSDKANKI